MKYFQRLDDIVSANKAAARFKTIIPSSRVRDIEAFKKEHGDFYDDFAPWILKEACKYGVISLVKDILERHPGIGDYEFYDVIGVMRRVSVNSLEAAASSDQYYPLSIAAERGHFEICELLINAGFKCTPQVPADAPGLIDVSHAFYDANLKIRNSQHLTKYLNLFIDQDSNEDHLFTFLTSNYDLRHEHNLEIFNRMFNVFVKDKGSSATEYLVSTLNEGTDGFGEINYERCRLIEFLPQEFVEKLESSIFEMRDFPFENGRRAGVLELCLAIHSVYSHVENENQGNLLKEAIKRSSQDVLDRALSIKDLMYSFALKTEPDFAHEMIFERASLSALERFVQNYETEAMSGNVFILANAYLINKKILDINPEAEENMIFRTQKTTGI